MKGEDSDGASGGASRLMSSLGVGMMVGEARRALFGAEGAGLEASASAGPRVGRYVLSRKLGSGGMGTVYEALDVTLGRSVALKVLHRDLRGRQHRRMQREALALARLSHPNVVHLYEIGRHEDRTFIAMELVHGRTLDQWQRERPGWRECVQVYLQAGRGLAAAHAVGLVHRDFKPSNCIVGGDGRVRVLDFGLAKVVDEDDPDASSTILEPGEVEGSRMDQRLTQTGAVLGTLAYMSPEQLEGRPTTEASDQFSFCVSLYEALYGTRPFVGDSMAELATALTAGPPGAAPKGSRVPVRIRRALLRGLAVDPRDRFPSMDALLQALTRMTRRGAGKTVWSVGVAAMIGAGAGVALSMPEPTPCREPSTALQGAWGEDDRAAVREAFVRSGLPAEDLQRRVEAALDGYAETWIEAHAASCRATFVERQQSEDVHDRRTRCLQRRRNRLESTVDLLAGATGAEELLERTALPFQLPSIDECADLDEVLEADPLPADEKLRERIAMIRRDLDEVETLKMAGDRHRAIALAKSAVEGARAVSFAPVLAEALELLGRAQAEAGWFEQAHASLQEAIAEAARAKHDVAGAKAWASLLYVLALQGRASDAELLEFGARAAVDRAGDDEARGWLFNNLGVAAAERGDSAQAVRHLEEAVRVKQLAMGEVHVDTGISWANLGNALMSRELHADAIDAFERARVVFEGTVGADHPLNAFAVEGLCRAEQARGHHDRAVELCGYVLEHLGRAKASVAVMARSRFLMARALEGAGRLQEARDQAGLALGLSRAEDPGLAEEIAAWIVAHAAGASRP